MPFHKEMAGEIFKSNPGKSWSDNVIIKKKFYT